MRRCRIKLPNRCYHLVSRIAHRAYFLDGDERTLGIASREYFTKVYLRPLAEAGLIARSDPGHPNSPQQKYALTKDGKRRIERVAPL